jgi:hypothetical protein
MIHGIHAQFKNAYGGAFQLENLTLRKLISDTFIPVHAVVNRMKPKTVLLELAFPILAFGHFKAFHQLPKLRLEPLREPTLLREPKPPLEIPVLVTTPVPLNVPLEKLALLGAGLGEVPGTPPAR